VLQYATVLLQYATVIAAATVNGGE
jgi:hypothetical protein